MLAGSDFTRLSLSELDPNWLLLGLTGVGVVVAISALREQTRNSRIEKVADVLMECTRRYADLVAFRYDLEAAVRRGELAADSAADRYFLAYWNLQWDQWNFYRLGLLPHQTLALWFVERLGTVKTGDSYFGVTFEDGWTQYGRVDMRTYPEFTSFVDNVFSLKDEIEDRAREKIELWLVEAYRKARSMRVDFVKRTVARI